MEKLKKQKKQVILIIMIAIIVVLFGLTYAYWQTSVIQTGENISKFDCFDIEFSDTGNSIIQENAYPMTDDQGLNTTKYTVTIKNLCNTKAEYNVYLNTIEKPNTLNPANIKVAVNGTTSLLSSKSTSVQEGYSDSHILANGTLLKNDSASYTVQLWMDYNTSETEGLNKVFYSEISVTALATK